MSDRFYRRAFLIGSIFNVSAGVLCIVFTPLSLEVFFGSQAASPGLVTVLFYRLFMAAVIVFGIGYFLVYLDLNQNHGIVFLGVASKLVLLSVFISCFILGHATVYLLLALAPDFLFMLVYAHFLWQKRRA